MAVGENASTIYGTDPERNHYMIQWDTHMHTTFSGDGHVSPSDMAKTAREKGLDGIIFTDHLDWDYMSEPGRFDLDIPAYYSEMKELQKNKNDDLPEILIGIELGLQEHLVSRHRQILAEYEFDQVIGSIHQVDGLDPYYEPYYKGKDIYEAYEDYLRAAISNLSLFPEIDTFGHLDYVSRYGIRHFGAETGTLRYEDHKASIDKILEFLITKSIALEVNTGAFRCEMTEPNPSYDIIRRYYEMGGRLITIGADAHYAEHIALSFEEVRDRLSEIGFTQYAVFKKREPIMLSL